MELSQEKDGFCGTFLLGAAHPNAVIIRVAGTGAKKRNLLSSSQFLLDAGFSVLCLEYDHVGNSRNQQSLIPLDYVARAIEWIEQNTELRDVKIGMTGISMGALYTLAAACYVPRLSTIALASPFDCVMEGLDASLRPTGHSTFTWRDEELPFQQWDVLREKKTTLFAQAVRDKNYGLGRLLRYVYDHNPWSAEALLPVEKIQADVLLLASKNDDCWPADVALTRIIKRLKLGKTAGRSIQYHLYEQGCHNIGGDMCMTGSTGLKMRLLIKSWRAHPRECEACIEDSKRRIVDFFGRALVK